MIVHNKKNTWWKRWGLALVMMLAIFLFSSIPSKEMPAFGQFDLSVKKGGHMLGYALLAAAYLYGLGPSTPGARLRAWLLAIVYATSDEIHQSFVPGRNAWVVDVGVDSVGALIGLWVAGRVWLSRYSPNSSSKDSLSSQLPKGSTSISPNKES